MAEWPDASTAPELVVESDGGTQVMSPGRVYHVGRDPESELVLSDARVSWHHAVLRAKAGHWTVEDEGSTNGTFADGRRVQESGVGPGSVIRFGNPADGPCAVLSQVPRPSRVDRPSGVSHPAGTRTFRRPSSVRPLPAARTTRIGRASDNELVVDDLTVSRRHAELRAGPEGFEIVDLGSHNGTYLNGRRVDRAPMIPGDIVGIGHSAFALVGGGLRGKYTRVAAGESVNHHSRARPSPRRAPRAVGGRWR
ncbi:FHA domain-containing protein, partial [Streptomyces inhibens]|uniref:FHA domain-containing protein n=1 Tax=Streptomyces inhibens TaxID=2293571 RepID=UPI0036C79D99